VLQEICKANTQSQRWSHISFHIDELHAILSDVNFVEVQFLFDVFGGSIRQCLIASVTPWTIAGDNSIEKKAVINAIKLMFDDLPGISEKC
jgi:hypothetical protein